MIITSVRMKKNKNMEDDKLLAVASVQFDNCLVVHGIKLIQLKDKRLISFPNKKIKKYDLVDDSYTENYEYTDLVHPSNPEFRQYIETELFRIYESESSDEIGG